MKRKMGYVLLSLPWVGAFGVLLYAASLCCGWELVLIGAGVSMLTGIVIWVGLSWIEQ